MNQVLASPMRVKLRMSRTTSGRWRARIQRSTASSARRTFSNMATTDSVAVSLRACVEDVNFGERSIAAHQSLPAKGRCRKMPHLFIKR